jgi:hypothetical protein
MSNGAEPVSKSQYDHDRDLLHHTLDNINKEFDRATNASRWFISVTAMVIAIFTFVGASFLALAIFLAYNIIGINRSTAELEQSSKTIADSLGDAPGKILAASKTLESAVERLDTSITGLNTAIADLKTTTVSLKNIDVVKLNQLIEQLGSPPATPPTNEQRRRQP